MATETVTLPPAVLTAAERLATTLAGAEPIAAYHRAKERLEADSDARDLLESFSSAQAHLRQSRSRVRQADVEHLRALQNEVQANSIIMAYAEAQQAAMDYLPEINKEISQFLGVDFAALAGPASC